MHDHLYDKNHAPIFGLIAISILRKSPTFFYYAQVLLSIKFLLRKIVHPLIAISVCARIVYSQYISNIHIQ